MPQPEPSNERAFWVAASLFCASAFVFLRNERLRKQKKGGDGSSLLLLSTEETMVSSRGLAALSPPIPYMKQFVACLDNPCHSEENPTGHIPLCVAENRLVQDMLAVRFTQEGTAAAAFWNSNVYCYDSFLGSQVAREGAAYFLARRFLFPEEPHLTPLQALDHINPKHVCLSAGTAPLLNHLFFLLGEGASDACLVPAPYYAAFENDMGVIAKVNPFPVEQVDPVRGPTEEELELAYRQARKRGLHPKFVLLTNPNNPLGTIYRPEIILRIVEWARRKTMHTIVDELYALSTHKKYDHAFQSIIKILNNDLRNDVHMLWAVSKDFGCSGLRVGLLYTNNETFIQGLATVNIFSGISGPIQYLVSELLTDDVWVDSFLDCSRDRIVANYRICTEKLKEMVVPFVPAEAGIFVYVDFSSLLPKKTFAWEQKFEDLVFRYARIVLTPGEAQRDSRPGMFRICYTWVSPEVLEIAMERLSKVVAKMRRLDWDDLNSRTLSYVLSNDI